LETIELSPATALAIHRVARTLGFGSPIRDARFTCSTSSWRAHTRTVVTADTTGFNDLPAVTTRQLPPTPREQEPNGRS